MKLLMENWRKFINEMEDVGETTEATPEEQESKTEEVLNNIETNEDEVLEFFEDNPEIADEIIKAAEEEKITENIEIDHSAEARKSREKTGEESSVLAALGTLVGAGAGLAGTLGIISGGGAVSPEASLAVLLGGFALTGVTQIVSALAKVAKKSKSEDTEELEED
jgi:hypothetical protein